MAVLVAQDHPDVIRRTPASGDGGIDLLIPDASGFIVQQVKGFAGRIGSSQRRQIKASWNEMQSNPRLERPITAWHLVVPTNPTPDEQSWFEALVAGADFPCEWRGEPHWDALAAKHAHVIDYYFGGGRERIRSRASAMLDPGEALSALDVAASHEKLRSMLNRDDPHYRYFFIESPKEIPPEGLPPCVLARTSKMKDGAFLTVYVRPRHDNALIDEPITGSLNVSVVGEDLVESVTQDLERFRRFGTAVELPAGSVTMTLDAPGGLGGTSAGGTARLMPMPQAKPSKWRFEVTGPDGTVIVAIRLESFAVSQGSAGGVVSLIDESRTIEVELQAELGAGEKGTLDVRFTMLDLIGRPAEDVLNSVRFLNALRSPNTCVLRPRHGKKQLAAFSLEADEPIAADWVLTFVEDLEEVQRIADFAVTVPDDVTEEFVRELHAFARMLRGEMVTGTWKDIVFELKPGVSRAEAEEVMRSGGVLVHEQGVSLELDGGEAHLGQLQTVFANARIDPLQLPDARKVRLIPGDDDTATRRLLRDD